MASEDGSGNSLIRGESIPVESVQALAAGAAGAAKNQIEIPERYIRPEIETDPVTDRLEDEKEIPIIDLNRLLDPQHSEDEAAKLKFACEEWGFFQLINYGVAAEVMERFKCDIREFFQLPLEEKNAFAQKPGTLEGYGQAFVLSEDQKLDWGDRFFLTTQPVTYRTMRLWPTQPPTFRETLDEYSMELKRVRDCLLGLMSKNLELAPTKLIDMFREGSQMVRMNYYPPCHHADKVLGLSPHSDPIGLTLLLQANDVQGLQIKRNGAWMPIRPLPNAFIINIGDILEIMSNGKYKSIEHRAVINPQKERLSIAAFHDPNRDIIVGPLPELAEDGEKYKTLSLENFKRLAFSKKLEGKSFLDQMKLNK